MKKQIRKVLPLLIIVLCVCILNSCKKNQGNDEHVHDIKVNQVIDATCTSEGYTIYKCLGCEYSYNADTTKVKEHFDTDFDYLCDYGCGTVTLDESAINNILSNTYNLTNVKLEFTSFTDLTSHLFYVQNDLIYLDNDDSESYIYENKLYTFDEIWSVNELDKEVSYTLESYFNLVDESYDFKNLVDITQLDCTYGYFINRKGFELTNIADIKLVIFINQETNTLDGFLVKDEFNNYVFEYVITQGVIEEYKTNILNIIEELKNDRCMIDDCYGKLIDGICEKCNSYQEAVLTTDLYDVNNDGTFDEVYEIYNVGQLYSFSDLVYSGNVNANAILMNDIILNENLISVNKGEEGSYKLNEGVFRKWNPIGGFNLSPIREYNGVFDGNNHTVYGVYVDDEDLETVGFIGYTASNVVIKNLFIKDSYIVGSKWVGGVVGYLEGAIENCGVSNSLLKGINNESFTGGVAGATLTGTINKCFSVECNISGLDFVGGITGSAYNSIIKNCYNTGYVYGNQYVGGIVGRLGSSTIYDSYNVGFVNKYHVEKNNVGSIAGAYYGASDIYNCYYLEETYSKGIYDSNVRFELNVLSLDAFKNGEVAYLLQKNSDQIVWGQNLGVDNLPNFTGELVYPILDEESNIIGYVNK